MKDDLGVRMKTFYEERSRTFLNRRTPVIIRLDGKAFHSFTKGMLKPFDSVLTESMQNTAMALCTLVQNCKMAYVQSDEISLLLTDWDKLTTDAWFDYNVQKITSVSASLATLEFNKAFSVHSFYSKTPSLYEHKLWSATFDSRAFNIPKEDVVNYFWWRQSDAIRNFILSLAQSKFSHKELQGKSQTTLLGMLNAIGEKVELYLPYLRKGTIVYKTMNEDGKSFWTYNKDVPLFFEDRNYIEYLGGLCE